MSEMIESTATEIAEQETPEAESGGNGQTPAPTPAAPAPVATRMVPNGFAQRLERLDPFAVGKVLAASGFFPDVRSEQQAVAKVIAGMELGFGPMAAMTGVHIIDGKPTLAANLLAAQVKRHPRYDYRVPEHTEEVCRIEFYELAPDGSRELIGESAFSMEDARRAGLLGKKNWRQYPRAMLFARALSEGVRTHCPDVTMGAPAYVPEELGAEVNEQGEPVNLPAPTPTAQAPQTNGTDQAQAAGQPKAAPKATPHERRPSVKPITPAQKGEINARLGKAQLSAVEASVCRRWWMIRKAPDVRHFDRLSSQQASQLIRALKPDGTGALTILNDLLAQAQTGDERAVRLEAELEADRAKEREAQEQPQEAESAEGGEADA